MILSSSNYSGMRGKREREREYASIQEVKKESREESDSVKG